MRFIPCGSSPEIQTLHSCRTDAQSPKVGPHLALARLNRPPRPLSDFGLQRCMLGASRSELSSC